MIKNNKLDMILGPAGIFSGYCFMAAGIYITTFSLTGLFLIAAGGFIAFTYDGTLIDFSSGRIKNYSSLFGLFKVGKWHKVSDFTKFRIYKSKRTHTTYSRANIPLDLSKSDIRLMLLNDSKNLKITVNKFNSFEDARKEMGELIEKLQMHWLKEWI